MDERENTRRTPSRAALNAVPQVFDTSADTPEGTGSLSASSTGSFRPANEELLSGTGSIPMIASSTGSLPAQDAAEEPSPMAFSTASAPAAPRYVRKRTPHRSQGTVDDLTEESQPSAMYTHDSNISVGGATPLSGMSYRRARSDISRVKNNSRYGQYLEIPKGRRTIFASRERARRRRSVLALVIVVMLLVLAAWFLWNMMRNLLG